jgi:hypothetical protein
MSLIIPVARLFARNEHSSYVVRFMLLCGFLKLKVKSGIQGCVHRWPSVTRKYRPTIQNNLVNDLKEYSALLILIGPYSLNAGEVLCRSEDGDCATDKEAASQEAANVARTFLMRPAVPVEEISVSPFMLHLFYQASAIYLESNQEAVTEVSSEALVVLKKILNVLDARWKAAGKHSAVRPPYDNSSTDTS